MSDSGDKKVFGFFSKKENVSVGMVEPSASVEPEVFEDEEPEVKKESEVVKVVLKNTTTVGLIDPPAKVGKKKTVSGLDAVFDNPAKQARYEGIVNQKPVGARKYFK